MENGNKILSVLAQYLMVKYKPKSVRFLTDSIQVTFEDCNEFTKEDFYYCIHGLNINVKYCDGDMIQFTH